MKPQAIIVDLDGTLCNIDHRFHLFKASKIEEFHGLIPLDQINKWCLEILRAFSALGVDIIYMTGREQRYETQTREWLNKHSLIDNYLILLMRPTGDERSDEDVKTDLYKAHIEPAWNVLFCLEDRQKVVDRWRELGLTCLQCAKGDY